MSDMLTIFSTSRSAEKLLFYILVISFSFIAIQFLHGFDYRTYYSGDAQGRNQWYFVASYCE